MARRKTEPDGLKGCALPKVRVSEERFARYQRAFKEAQRTQGPDFNWSDFVRWGLDVWAERWIQPKGSKSSGA